MDGILQESSKQWTKLSTLTVPGRGETEIPGHQEPRRSLCCEEKGNRVTLRTTWDESGGWTVSRTYFLLKECFDVFSSNVFGFFNSLWGHKYLLCLRTQTFLWFSSTVNQGSDTDWDYTSNKTTPRLSTWHVHKWQTGDGRIFTFWLQRI